MIAPMKTLLLLLSTVVAATACSPTAYYVANIYRDGNDLYTERCAIDSGRSADKPDPNNCKYEVVGPLPPELRAHVNAAPAMTLAPAPTPAPAAGS
jgi:hypothetical protein